ncbi:MAG: DNA mismatch repair protein MutS [Synergistaceae bacterium]|nr:DNA mismatch repair protein MutS [Synergistaceae bacterium]
MKIIPDDIKITPWLEQYKSFKSQYPDALLLFRMGDFYELFFDDARTASKTLDIALTARDTEKKIPMAGIPHHALNVYLDKLIKAGYRAAICEQVGEAKSGAIVNREIVRVATPGTYVPEESFAFDSGHLAAIYPVKNKISLALLSVDTGNLEAGTLPEREALALITAFAPGEILYPSNVKNIPDSLKEYNLLPVSPESFRLTNAAGKLKSALNSSRLEGFGINESDTCIAPAWAVLDYLTATQFTSINNILKLSPLALKNIMSLDTSAVINLQLIPEVAGDSISLLQTLDKTRTPMGKRTLKDWLLRPLMDINRIKKRQEAINSLVQDISTCSRLRDLLSGTRDIERALSRLALKTSNPLDLAAIRDTLRIIPDIKALDILHEIINGIPDLSELNIYLDDSLEDNLTRNANNVIKSGFDSELDRWRSISSDGESWLAEYLERERANTQTPKLKAGYTNAFGYYLEVGKGGLTITPEYFRQTQTLVNAKRYTTPELKNFESRMNASESEISRLENELYNQVIQKVLTHSKDLQLTGRLLGLIDCIASCAVLARERNYVRPIINESTSINITNGRHPVIESELKLSGFTPNDVNINESSRIIILTGPNMAGKSTWLRMTALLTIMAQAGLFIPAEAANIGLVDRIFTRIGARDDLLRGNSTFMIEMLETANILNNLTDRSLIILDEVGRGTATFDGMSIAWAVLEYLQTSRARVLFATHYHELTCLEQRLSGIKNYSMKVSENDSGILFLHQVIEGPASRSYGIEVARLAGLPDIVLRRAFDLLAIFEREGTNIDSKTIPEPLQQKALKRQIMLLSPESDAIIEELASLDIDNITPLQALKLLHKFSTKSREI